jgi:polar amino acid transport system substrate-binding protein
MSDVERTDVKLYDSVVYLVFSKNISKSEISEWHKALDEVRKTKYDTIYKEYIE